MRDGDLRQEDERGSDHSWRQAGSAEDDVLSLSSEADAGSIEHGVNAGAESRRDDDGGAVVGASSGWRSEVLAEEEEASSSGEVAEEVRRLCSIATRDNRLEEVLDQLGVRLRRGGAGRGIANCPSPVHERRSPTLEVDLSDDQFFWCSECGACGDSLDLIGLAHGVASWGEQFGLLTGVRPESLALPEYVQVIADVGMSRRAELLGQAADAARLDAVYRALLDLFPLYESHLDELGRRFGGINLSQYWCWERGYRSLPPCVEERVSLCAELVDGGFDLRGVPGFFVLPVDPNNPEVSGRWCFAGDAGGRRVIHDECEATEFRLEGFIAPIRDSAGRIVRLEVHNDPPPNDAPLRVRARWKATETTLVGEKRSGRSSRGAFDAVRVHHAAPNHPGRDAYPGGVVIIEGASDADLIACRYELYVLGVPAFGALTDETIDAVARFEKALILIADGNRAAAERLSEQVLERGIAVELLSYNRYSRGNYLIVNEDAALRRAAQEVGAYEPQESIGYDDDSF